jgi:hypothetical protein
MITAKQKRNASGRKNAGDRISITRNGPDVFPHLRASAVRRLLSSETERGKPKKVPWCPVNKIPWRQKLSPVSAGRFKIRSRTSLCNGNSSSLP